MPLVPTKPCTPCTCFKAKTANEYAGCLATCSKVKNRCPPADLAPAPTDQTGLGGMLEPGADELAALQAARDVFVQSVNGRFAGSRIRVRLLLEDDEPDMALTR